MTNSSDRLDRIEALAEDNERKVNALVSTVTAQQQQIGAQQQQIGAIATAVQQTMSAVQQTITMVQQSTENITQILTRQDQMIASINAELERQGRILDYLLGQQGQQEDHS